MLFILLSGGSRNWKGGDNVSAPLSFIGNSKFAQRATCFLYGKRLIIEKYEVNGDSAPPPAFESATDSSGHIM